ncbi:MAG: alpha/beta hydrolase, partial [Oscillospiraceae bacterium]|nr:alpha/beta hydrolase [Oscillospiraceae bacterium]
MKRIPVKHIPANPSLEGLSRLITDVVYSEAQGKPLHLDLLIPWTVERKCAPGLYPLIVFIQGSSWTT